MGEAPDGLQKNSKSAKFTAKNSVGRGKPLPAAVLYTFELVDKPLCSTFLRIRAYSENVEFAFGRVSRIDFKKTYAYHLTVLC